VNLDPPRNAFFGSYPDAGQVNEAPNNAPTKATSFVDPILGTGKKA